eukprot:jgi/Psemu1/18655/gm1.18655_g
MIMASLDFLSRKDRVTRATDAMAILPMSSQENNEKVKTALVKRGYSAWSQQTSITIRTRALHAKGRWEHRCNESKITVAGNVEGIRPTQRIITVPPKGSLSSLLSENYRGATSSRLQYQNEESPISVVTPIPVKTSIKENKDAREWGLREEWALQDSVPRYTIGTDVATFWTQLKHSTPEFASWTEDELEDRYREFYSHSKDSLLVECGPSPTLLSDWWIASSNSNSNSADKVTMMGGSLLNGSEIWFPLEYAGTLGEDPRRTSSSEVITKDTLDDCYISTFMTLHTSSYAESMDGIVYELGFPRCEANKIHGPRSSNTNSNTNSSSGNTNIQGRKSKEITTGSVVPGGQLDKMRQIFVSKVTHNAEAILVASTPSAYTILDHCNTNASGIKGQPGQSCSICDHTTPQPNLLTQSNGVPEPSRAEGWKEESRIEAAEWEF